MPLTTIQEAALYGDREEWERLYKERQKTQDDILEAFLIAYPEADQDDIALTGNILTWDKPQRDQLATLTFDVLGDGSKNNPYRFER